jgi:hypothetical protein
MAAGTAKPIVAKPLEINSLQRNDCRPEGHDREEVSSRVDRCDRALRHGGDDCLDELERAEPTSCCGCQRGARIGKGMRPCVRLPAAAALRDHAAEQRAELADHFDRDRHEGGVGCDLRDRHHGHVVTPRCRHRLDLIEPDRHDEIGFEQQGALDAAAGEQSGLLWMALRKQSDRLIRRQHRATEPLERSADRWCIVDRPDADDCHRTRRGADHLLGRLDHVVTRRRYRRRGRDFHLGSRRVVVHVDRARRSGRGEIECVAHDIGCAWRLCEPATPLGHRREQLLLVETLVTELVTTGRTARSR